MMNPNDSHILFPFETEEYDSGFDAPLASPASYLNFLTESEIVLLGKHKLADRKNAFIAGRRAAKRALQRHSHHLKASEISIINEESGPTAGRPHILVNGKAHGHISIAHRKGMAVGIWNENPIGIDVEVDEPKDKSLIQQFFLEEEQRFVDQYQGLERFTALMMLWTAKEAMSKAIGKGLRLSSHHLKVLTPEGTPIVGPSVPKWNLMGEAKLSDSLTGLYILELYAMGSKSGRSYVITTAQQQS